MKDDQPYVMSPVEIVWGYVFGHKGSLAPPSSEVTSPREALEATIRHSLERPPCGVAFSGGKDSSAVLAVATHVARRDGLPDPIPVTKVFPEVPEAEESHWQEMVVRHLELDDWHRVTVGADLDLVGPLAAEHLVEYGVVWPPTIHADRPVVASVRGGSLIDGEGGDEVLSVAAHRIAPLTALIRSRRRPTIRRLARAATPAMPARIRARRVHRRVADQEITWLRRSALDALIEALGDVESAAPLSFAESVRTVPKRRSQVLLAHNRRVLAREHGVAVCSPLLHPDFVHALARDCGFLGRGDRTQVLRWLVPDLLPEEILARTSKALFGGAYWGRHTREFAAAWNGEGVDSDLVDPDELKRLWCSERHNALTAALLQQAWLADRR